MALGALFSLSVIGFILLIAGIIYIAGLNFEFYLPTDACYPNAGTTGCPYGSQESLTANVLIWLGLALFVAFGGAAAMVAVAMSSVGSIIGGGIGIGAEAINAGTYPIRDHRVHHKMMHKKHKSTKSHKGKR